MVRKIKSIKTLEFNRCIIRIAIVLSFTKGFIGERVFIGVLGLALLFNFFD